MLLSYDPNEPVYLGFRHNSTTVSQGYMNGGAGKLNHMSFTENQKTY